MSNSPFEVCDVYYDDSSQNRIKHLFFVIAKYEDFQTSKEKIISVNITSNPPSNEKDHLVLTPNDHPLIKHDSYVYFQKMSEIIHDEIIKDIKKSHPPANVALINKIIEYAMNSKFVSAKIKKRLTILKA